VNEVINVANFVTSGTRVDVLTILQTGNAEPISRVVVSNVQVLTANNRYDQEDAKQGEAIRSTVVTLMVTPTDAEKIALAQAQGQLMLTLRNPLDVAPTETTGTSVATLFGGVPKVTSKPTTRRVALPVAQPPAPVVPVVTPWKVETIKGGKSELDTLDD
jgi:pilus assembly protein CpaB